MQDEEVDLGPHRVVVNDEDQYSILLVGHSVPPGWRDAGYQGSKKECLAYVGEVWTDMRPLSLRRRAE